MSDSKLWNYHEEDNGLRIMMAMDHDIAKIPSLYPRLSSLVIVAYKLTDEGLAPIRYLRDLKSLTLNRATITDASVPTILSLNWLESLSLNSIDITQEGIRQLAKLPRLTTFNLNNIRFDPAILGMFPGLKKVRSDRRAGPSEAFDFLRAQGVEVEWSELRNYDADRQAFISELTNDRDIADLAACYPTLKVASLSHSTLTTDGLRGLVGLNELDTLFLHQTEITTDARSTLLSLPSLRRLSLPPTFDPRALRDLAPLPNLETLILPKSLLTAQAIAPLPVFPSLRRLVVGTDALPASDIRSLNTLGIEVCQFLTEELWIPIKPPPVEERPPNPFLAGPDGTLNHLIGQNFEDLLANGEAAGHVKVIRPEPEKAMPDDLSHLVGRDFEDVREELESYGALSDMSHILDDSTQIAGTDFTDDRLKDIAGWRPDLQMAFLAESPISDAAITELARCKQLEQLSIGQTRVTRACLPAILTMQQLTCLDLGGLPFTDDDLLQLRRLPNLRELMLGGVRVGPEVIRSLPSWPALERVCLTPNLVSPHDLSWLLGQGEPQVTLITD